MNNYEDKDIVIPCSSLNSKFYVLLMGNLMEENTEIIVAKRGELYGDSLIKNGTLPEEAQKKFEIKKNLEEVLKYKEDNLKLRERLYVLTTQLRELENEYSNSRDNEATSIAKAKKGIETINDMFDHFNKIKQREMGEIEENENDDNGNINEGENYSNNVEEGKNEY